MFEVYKFTNTQYYIAEGNRCLHSNGESFITAAYFGSREQAQAVLDEYQRKQTMKVNKITRRIQARTEWATAEIMWKKTHKVISTARVLGNIQEVWAIVKSAEKAAAQVRKAAWAITHAEHARTDLGGDRDV